MRLVGGCCYAVRMFEGGVFPRVPAGGAVGALVLTVPTVLVALVVRACSLVRLGAMWSWWLLPGGASGRGRGGGW